MPKRRSEEDAEERRKKIEKLERRIKRYRSQDEMASTSTNNVEQEQTTIPVGIEELEVENVENVENIENVVDLSNMEEPELVGEELLGEDDINSLPNEVLLALGEENPQEKGYGENIHTDIIKRMDGILMKGLPKEQKDTIMKNSLIPANMKLLDAPKLNNELNGILNPATKSRDKLLEGKQQELGTAGASVLYAIHQLTKGDLDKVKIIKTLSDASRLICSLHHEYTQTRKKLISPHLDRSLCLNLKENTRSDFLYTKLEDTVKSLSTIKRASNALKPRPQKERENPKNYYQPPRRPFQGSQPRTPARGGHQQQPQRYQPRLPMRGQGHRLPPPAGRGRARYP